MKKPAACSGLLSGHPRSPMPTVSAIFPQFFLVQTFTRYFPFSML
jgi:hypothetical protein